MAIPIEVVGDVPQKNSCLFEFPLTDYDSTTPVVKANIQTATMSIFLNDRQGRVINDFLDEDVIDDFDANGNFARILTAADNQIQVGNVGVKEELHAAVVTIVATGVSGNIELEREMLITVVNQRHVPNLTGITVAPTAASAVVATVAPTVIP